jgi:L-malate glycosyltransferase
MNILIVPSWFPSKKEPFNGSFFLEQAQALVNNGHKVYVFDCSYQSKKNLFRLSNFIPTKTTINQLTTYSFTCLPLFTFKRKTAFFRYRLKLGILFFFFWKKLKIDVVHAHATLPSGYAIARLANKIRFRFVVTEHSSLVFDRTLMKRYLGFYDYTFKKASKIISLTKFHKQLLIKISSLNNIQIVPNMVNSLFFITKEKENRPINDKFVFISIGNLNLGKNFEKTIIAFKQAFKLNKRYFLYIVGNGPEKQNLNNLIKNLELSRQVFLLGLKTRSEINELFKNSNVFVLFSQFETFGVSYIEALAAGLPILALKNGGSIDIVNRDNGIIISKNTVDALRQGFIKIYNDYEFYNKNIISSNCYKNYSEEVVTKQLLNLYQKVITNETK